MIMTQNFPNDTTFENTPIPPQEGLAVTAYWNCEDWNAWHKALVIKWGLSQANLIWKDAWQKYPLEYLKCDIDSDFVTYAKTNMLDITYGAFPNTQNTIITPVNTNNKFPTYLLIGGAIILLVLIIFD